MNMVSALMKPNGQKFRGALDNTLAKAKARDIAGMFTDPSHEAGNMAGDLLALDMEEAYQSTVGSYAEIDPRVQYA
jgi:hypothetical protein